MVGEGMVPAAVLEQTKTEIIPGSVVKKPEQSGSEKFLGEFKKRLAALLFAPGDVSTNNADTVMRSIASGRVPEIKMTPVQQQTSLGEQIKSKQTQIDTTGASVGEVGLREMKAKLADLTAELDKLTHQINETSKMNKLKMKQAEVAYLEKYKGVDGLSDRYEKADTNQFRLQIEEYAGKAGVHHKDIQELTGKSFNRETGEIIRRRVQEQIDRLFNSDYGRRNQEKYVMVTEQTERYLELVSSAQDQRDLPLDLDASMILRHLEANIWSLAYQDRVASENMLGDHGIRHLIGHNTLVGETELVLIDMVNTIRSSGIEMTPDDLRRAQQIFIQNCQKSQNKIWSKHIPLQEDYRKAWQVVREQYSQLPADLQFGRAIDRLSLHEVMIHHDEGYAMDPVRSDVNSQKFSADRGHNVLSAKGVSENHLLRYFFPPEQMVNIHQGVLEHDGPSINIAVGDASDKASKDNLMAIIHVADLSHAFEDKLPELLYSVPETLKVLKLMKSASELGEQGTVLFTRLRGNLIDRIKSNSNFSDDDKEALIMSAQSITMDNYKLAADRICGNKPAFYIDAIGRQEITVQESEVHSQVMGMLGQGLLKRMRKFVGDVTGVPSATVDLTKDVVSSDGRLTIRTRTGQEAANEAKTNYQQILENLLSDSTFRNYIIMDKRLAEYQLLLQEQLYSLEAVQSVQRDQLMEQLNRRKAQRIKLLERQLIL